MSLVSLTGEPDVNVALNAPVLQPNPQTYAVAQRIADAKISQDYTCKTHEGRERVGHWVKANVTCPLHPSSYAARIIPFLNWNKAQPKSPAFVPVEIALGSCIGGFPEHIKPEHIKQRIEKYRTNGRTGGGGTEPACGDYVPELSLYVAHEGKHRVAFMRQQGEPCFLSNVHVLNYPAAHRIKIIRSSDFPDCPYFVVLDGRYLQMLSQAPYISIDLLKSYGVEEVSWRELNAPTEQFVFNAIVESGLLWRSPDDISEAARSFDLVKLAADELAQIQAQTKKQNRSIVDRFVDWIHRVTS